MPQSKKADSKQQLDVSSGFSDALNREKLRTKSTKNDTPPQHRGSKVAPGIAADPDASSVNPTAAPPKRSSVAGTKAKNELASSKRSSVPAVKSQPALSTTAASKRSSTPVVKAQPESTSTAPQKRSGSAGKKRKSDTATPAATDPEQDPKENKGGDPEQDAKGLYDIFVQTRRCEELCSGLGLTMSDIRKMKRKYDDNDMYHSGEITQAEFFFMINEERRPLTLGIFKFADVPESQKFLSFDQYLLCVVSFAVLTKPELYQFVFDLYDADQSGALDEREVTKMSLELQSKQFHFPANVTAAINMLQGKEGRAALTPDDGLVDLGEFMKFAKSFPVAFYPIMNMQKNVRESTLGESYWSRITANKLRVQELVSYMRRHHGAIPQLSFRESVVSIFSREIFNNRKRAGELYALELANDIAWTLEKSRRAKL
ncbi:hypothetical protein PR003_g12427 [Phytophthora rubi]|uniref:EF-hand domain-containing protein n=1 Tax=Phytophthora rubi TaxID=129364 RepID=A0A6A3MPG8_9STRA|nr:hypothetical protein PR001_g11024 [Phytophthora rubi]KAE9336606.1 hypothetical protein PR003_g12427 [Phytophthora rubi]